MNAPRRIRSGNGFSCAAIVLAMGGAASALTIHVPADQPTIQAGINAAVNGDVVEGAPGTYNEAINFNGKAITLQSSGGADVTTIDATGLNTSVVRFISGEGLGSVLRGFKITGGKGIISDTIFRSGGGL